MLGKSEDALICDMAETYHIYDWRSLPIRLAAKLAYGLHDDSRSKLLLSGARFGVNTFLLANIADTLRIIAWQRTKDGQKGTNKPKLILETLTTEPKKDQSVTYATAEDYEAAREKIIKEIQKNGRH